jgi:hypothetical protein
MRRANAALPGWFDQQVTEPSTINVGGDSRTSVMGSILGTYSVLGVPCCCVLLGVGLWCLLFAERLQSRVFDYHQAIKRSRRVSKVMPTPLTGS